MFDLAKPWLLVMMAGGFAILMDFLVRRQVSDKDSGGYWNRVVLYCIYPLFVILIVCRLTAKITNWPKYLTLYLDFEHPDAALLIPVIAWVLALIACWLIKPSTEESTRWLAGSVGFGNNRYWILWCVLYLSLIIVSNASDLGYGDESYPSALWSALAVTNISLIAIALSNGNQPLSIASNNELATPSSQQLTPWPELMKTACFDLKPLCTFKPQISSYSNLSDYAQLLASYLNDMDMKAVAPELIEVAASMMQKTTPPNDGFGHAQLVFASDDCGQLEIISLMAMLLDQRSKTISLIVTANGAAQLTTQLQHCLPAYHQRIATLSYEEFDENALIWVVDAEILSDRLLLQIKDKARLIRRIGLVTWWQMQDYSGVMAANLWAITRRLHRLLRFHGCHDILTLALLRIASSDAQQGDFVRHLLPHDKPPAVTIEAYAAHSCTLHLLDAKRDDNLRQYLLFRATKTSVQGIWSTYLELPEFISNPECTAFYQEKANDKNIGNQLAKTPSLSGVRLLQLQATEVLDLSYKVNQGGRKLVNLTEHHIGIMPSLNPYANYWLNFLQKQTDFFTSRRLVCAESSSAVIERHLLQGLNELPDTRNGLLKRSMWGEEIVNETLQSLAMQGRLSKTEVRFLNHQRRLEIDLEYRSSYTPANTHHPLNTVGLQLLEVREVAAEGNGDGIRLRVDPERRLIKAYPQCIFVFQGQRYRMRDWNKQADRLECLRVDQSLITWRIHTAKLSGIRVLAGTESTFLGKQGCIERLAVTANYEEEVTGYIQWTTDSHRQPDEQPTKNYYHPLKQNFISTALVLRLENQPTDSNALPSLCQVMRYVLPVHLGVEEDALEVITLDGEKINGEQRSSYGIAIVDLYPNGGIGLINAIYDDNTLLRKLLGWARNWLNESPDDILNTPMCLAANPDVLPQKQSALDLLNKLID